jgi:hypothetical protein
MMPLYNNFPVTYQNGYTNPQYQQQSFPQNPMYGQQFNQQYSQSNVQNQTPSGFIRVQSENEARMYPVAPGNSVSFVNENLPYIYTKTVDTSQLDRPKFEKYKLVKEEADAVDFEQPEKEEIDYSKFALKDDMAARFVEVENRIKELSVQINNKKDNNRR